MLTFKKAVKLETCMYLLCMQVMIKYMQRIYNIYIYGQKSFLQTFIFHRKPYRKENYVNVSI